MISSQDLQRIKLRFGIIGESVGLMRSIETALQIAPTDVTVLVVGESGVGKEVFPKIIHQNSARKHGAFIAVNCGAIPEGTIDSELFGHKKGSFTDAVSERKGYFEVADGGTIFLDEVGELPLPTQARLLRVLESGEFMKVGSSEVQKTNIRVVAATNVDLVAAIKQGRFRQDLYYRLNTVTIDLPPLRDRGDDVLLLFRKFAADFSDKYRMPPVRLQEEAQKTMLMYRWPGNIRELRNLVERLSVIAEDRDISRDALLAQLPSHVFSRLPAVVDAVKEESHGSQDRFSGEVPPSGSQIPNDIVYKMLLDLKLDVNELKQLIKQYGRFVTEAPIFQDDTLEPNTPSRAYPHSTPVLPFTPPYAPIPKHSASNEMEEVYEEVIAGTETPLSLDQMEREYILQLLSKNNGNRKKTAKDLKISERTLYRKLKDHSID